MGSKGVSQRKPQISRLLFAADISAYFPTRPDELSPGQSFVENYGTTLYRYGTNLNAGMSPNVLKE